MPLLSVMRLLIISEAAVPSGFARVIRSIFGRLRDDFEIQQLATRYDGGEHDVPWRLHAAATDTDPYGVDRVAPLIDAFAPDVVFILNDIPLEARYVAAVRSSARNPPMVVYAPVESGPVVPELIAPFEGIARLVTYTEYGKRELEAAAASIRLPPIDVVQHGVDTKIFRAIPGGRTEARRQLMPGIGGVEDLFIILNANRNMPRKNIDITIRAFAHFAVSKPPNVRLWLHMGIEDRGWNTVVLARRFGILDRLMLTSNTFGPMNVDEETLNLIYNACDVGVNTCSGDAWGMVSFEHAAAGAAQVVPDHTAQSDLWHGAALLVPSSMTVVNTTVLTDAYLLAPEDVAQAFERLYGDRELLRTMSAAASANAHRPEYSWNVVAARWRQILAGACR